jgi:hypothetical protein
MNLGNWKNDQTVLDRDPTQGSSPAAWLPAPPQGPKGQRGDLPGRPNPKTSGPWRPVPAGVPARARHGHCAWRSSARRAARRGEVPISSIDALQETRRTRWWGQDLTMAAVLWEGDGEAAARWRPMAMSISGTGDDVLQHRGVEGEVNGDPIWEETELW